MVVEALAVAGLLTGAFSTYMNYQAGQQRAAAARQNAQANRLQANELLRQTRIEEERRRLQGRRFLDDQRGMMRASEMLTQANINILSETVELMELDILRMRRDARFAAGQIRQGAMEFDRASQSILKAAKWDAATGAAGIAAQSGSLLYDAGVFTRKPSTGIKMSEPEVLPAMLGTRLENKA
jgi:hypothetical protein